jgi:hypothetical protein
MDLRDQRRASRPQLTMKLQDDEQFGNDMGRMVERLYGLFERVPQPKWVPCRRKKHYINAANYPTCVDCEREDFEGEQNRHSRGRRRP